MLRWLSLLACASLAVSALAALPTPLAENLERLGIPESAVSLLVQPVDAEAPSHAHRPNAPMNPASLMKIVTTFAALERLGPAHVFRTEALALTPPAAGILAGDLYLRGSGDPKLTHERLWLLLRELRGRGIVEIRGDLVLDDHIFAPAPHDPAAFDGKPLRPYNVGPNGLLFNFATLSLLLLPDDGRLRVFADPLPAGWTLDQRIRLLPGSCPEDWRDRLHAVFDARRIRLGGAFALACGEKRWHLAGLDNALLLAGVFRRYWQELGGRIGGGWRRAPTPAGARLLAVSESPPLAELIRDINKHSNNVMAEQLFLALGEGTPTSAKAFLQDWLRAKGIAPEEFVLDNGSGLSRQARLSAAALARLLKAAWNSPLMPEFVASLPIVGVDGTTKRYPEGAAAGHAHLKTGTLDGVRGIAGYLQDHAGRRWIVVFLINHPAAAVAQPAIEALLAGLWGGGF